MESYKKCDFVWSISESQTIKLDELHCLIHSANLVPNFVAASQGIYMQVNKKQKLKLSVGQGHKLLEPQGHIHYKNFRDTLLHCWKIMDTYC